MSEIFWVISESSETLQLQSEIYKHCLLYLLELELEYIQQFPLVETEYLQGKERYNLRKWGEEWYKPQGVVGCNVEWVESNGFGSSNQFELTRGLGLLWVNFPVVHDSSEAAWVKVTLSYSIWQWVELGEAGSESSLHLPGQFSPNIYVALKKSPCLVNSLFETKKLLTMAPIICIYIL